MSGDPFVLAQLSDPHVQVGTDDGASVRALAAAVDAIVASERAPDAVLVTGDIAEHAAAREYERARELLAPLTMPVHVLPGNHDDPDALTAHFGTPPRYAVRCGPLRLVACDTTLRDRDDGRLDVAWLESQLAEDPDTPTVVAMHHGPLRSGIAALDAIGLPDEDRCELASLLARRPQVRRVVTGHLHRAITGALGGCPVFVCPSSHMQTRLDLRADAPLQLVPEPPAFALHVALAGELVSHVQPI
jgi:3',5'-cyclic-AMP phosphodiesterase